jgi:hypothetical protein
MAKKNKAGKKVEQLYHTTLKAHSNTFDIHDESGNSFRIVTNGKISMYGGWYLSKLTFDELQELSDLLVSYLAAINASK